MKEKERGAQREARTESERERERERERESRREKAVLVSALCTKQDAMQVNIRRSDDRSRSEVDVHELSRVSMQHQVGWVSVA